MNLALYTAIYGPYDWVKPLPFLGIPAYLYTDSEVTAEKAAAAGWEPRIVRHGIATLNGDPAVTGPMLAHKWWKTHPELACPGVDVSLWIDGSMQLLFPDYPEKCLQALGQDDWSCMRHPWRDCIYTEGEYSATLTWRYDSASVLRQIEAYRSFHPGGWGLIATGANVRRHTPAVLALSDLWWVECVNWSHQDQLSLPVLLRLSQQDPAPVRWNMDLPWATWWILHEHGGGA